MRFWDSSVVVPLLVHEVTTAAAAALLEHDPVQVVWWATPVECASAIARLERAGELSGEDAALAFDRLDTLADGWHEVQAVESLRQTARRLLRVHDLRAADALQLAAAVVASEDDPASLELVSLDDRLVDAARREGFAITAVG